jgi:hypothetical protein
MKYEADRININMWHVYAIEATEPQDCGSFPDCNCDVGACKHPGEECIGIVCREIGDNGETLGWLAENHSSADLPTQRTPRPSAYQAAKDMWGPDAADAVM